MKITIGILTLLFLNLNSIAQNRAPISEDRQHQIDTIAELVRNDRINELADRILFPIRRPNPIPNLKTKEDFILYYPILFDSAFKAKLTNTKFDRSNTIDRDDGFGLLLGDIWLIDDGRIMTINYNSQNEEKLQIALHQELENKMHSSVSDWKSNVLVCETDKFLIRIDYIENNELRYISWTKPKKINEKPDLILLDGNQEFHGTAGGITYRFKSGEWVYQVDRVEIAENDDQLGLYLRLFQNQEMKLNLKTTEIK